MAMVSGVRWIRVSASTPPSPSADPSHRTSFKEVKATSSPGTSLERDDGTRLPLRRVAVSKLPAWRQDLFGFLSFTCKSQENREPTSGLEPLTPAPATNVMVTTCLRPKVLLAELRSYPRTCRHGSQADPSGPTLFMLHQDLPRTYHDHDRIPGHPSDYPRL